VLVTGFPFKGETGTITGQRRKGRWEVKLDSPKRKLDSLFITERQLDVLLPNDPRPAQMRGRRSRTELRTGVLALAALPLILFNGAVNHLSVSSLGVAILVDGAVAAVVPAALSRLAGQQRDHVEQRAVRFVRYVALLYLLVGGVLLVI